MEDGNDLLAGTREEPKVLLVEDDPVFALLIERVFREHGIFVSHANNAEAALEMHRRSPYKLVVSDWVMPGMSGIDLCREIRQLDSSYVYFMLYTVRGQRSDRFAAFDAGVDDFLSKPLDREEFGARLKVASRLLSSKEALRRQTVEVERAARDLSELNASLRVASARFEALFDGLPAACFAFDREGMIHAWNRGAEQVFGIETERAINHPVWYMMDVAAPGTWNRARVEAVFSSSSETSFDWTFAPTDGPMRYLACSVICLPEIGGGEIGAVCVNMDITERKLAERRIESQVDQIQEIMRQLEAQKEALEVMNGRLQDLSNTDGLTGLLNHRRFQEMLEEAVQHHREVRQPFSLILMDLDDFKTLNDEFGHQAGDEALVLFAETLRSAARQDEQPARYGGEEFAIVLYGCDEEGAKQAAERFRTKIAEQLWPHKAVTGSVGISTWNDEGGMTPKELVYQADRALYWSKQHGKNCSMHFSQLPMAPTAA